MSRPLSRVAPARPHGFTLLELTIVLVVTALLTAAGARWTEAAHSSGLSVAAQAGADAAGEALRSFVRTNYRLPCPDLTGSGRESPCVGAPDRVGWLPVVTLGMADSRADNDLLKRPRYAVYRTASADLAQPASALATNPRQALFFALSAAASAPVDPSQPQVGRDAADCAAQPGNVAFVVAVPVDAGAWAPAQAAPCFLPSLPIASETAAGLLAEVSR